MKDVLSRLLPHFLWAIIIAGVLFVGLSQWKEWVNLQAQNIATQKAQQAVIEDLRKQVADSRKQLDDLQARQVKRDVQYRKDVAEAQKKTPEEVVAAIPGVLPITPKILSNLQPGPQMAQIPVSELKGLYEFGLECQKCKADLEDARQFVSHQADIITSQDKQLKATETQRDAAIKASKGGSWLHRLGRSFKVIVCAGAGGGGGAALAGAKGGAIGAFAGAAVCSLF